MPRIRQIKPDFYLDDDLAKCSRDARLLFPSLWILADRSGRLEDRPVRIKAQTFPYDADIGARAVDDMLNELASGGHIQRYENGGRKYIQIKKFSKHQYCHLKEPKSEIPEPPKPDASPMQERGKPSGVLSIGDGVLSIGDGVLIKMGPPSNNGGDKSATLQEKQKRPRKKDPLWDALVEVMGNNPDEFTKAERSKWNSACKQLRDAGATPEEIKKRSIEFMRRYPDCAITPNGIATNWSSLGVPPARAGPAKRTKEQRDAELRNRILASKIGQK